MHSELNWAKGKPYLKQTKAKQKKTNKKRQEFHENETACNPAN
jgi:hypothetical protein